MTPDAHNSSAASGGCIALVLILLGAVIGAGAVTLLWWITVRG